MVRRSREDPKMQRLRAIDVFADAKDRSLERLVAVSDEVEVAAGASLIVEDHHYGECYVVMDGTVSVLVGGKEVAQVSEGGILGELAFLTREFVASATVVAKTPLSLLVIPYNRLDQILEENPDLVRSMAAQLAARLRVMDVLYSDSSG